MAALPDSDLRRILGENFRAKQDEIDAANGHDDARRDRKAQVDSQQMRKAFVVYAGLVALLLAAAARLSPTTTGMWIQVVISLTVAVLCAAYYLYLRAEVRKGLRNLDQTRNA